MQKTIILILTVLMLGFIVSCKGARSVKVVIEHNDFWTAWMGADDDTRTLNGFYSKTVDLGDYKKKVYLSGRRIVDPDAESKRIRLAIIEEYEPGFLYTASSDVKAEVSANTNTSILYEIEYDFKNDFN